MRCVQQSILLKPSPHHMQPCNQSAWEYGGYSPASINGSDALLAESWVQGSLVGAVQALLSSGVTSTAKLLLLDDTPNCDLYPVQVSCIETRVQTS
jgi:hypothetical protein